MTSIDEAMAEIGPPYVNPQGKVESALASLDDKALARAMELLNDTVVYSNAYVGKVLTKATGTLIGEKAVRSYRANTLGLGV